MEDTASERASDHDQEETVGTVRGITNALLLLAWKFMHDPA